MLQLSDRLGEAEVHDAYLRGLVSGHGVSASLVCDENGAFIGPDGTSRNLAGPTDRLWLAALRRNSQLVLTSGLTFRKEHYKMPRMADLAVLTGQGIDDSGLLIAEGQKFHLLTQEPNFTAALSSCLNLGYRRIHVEFGPSGIMELMATSSLTLWLSSPSKPGLLAGAKALGSAVTPVAEIGGLWLGKATSAAWQRA